MKSPPPTTKRKMIRSTLTINITLHSNYLGFAVQAAAVKPYAKRPFDVPVSRDGERERESR